MSSYLRLYKDRDSIFSCVLLDLIRFSYTSSISNSLTSSSRIMITIASSSYSSRPFIRRMPLPLSNDLVWQSKLFSLSLSCYLLSSVSAGLDARSPLNLGFVFYLSISTLTASCNHATTHLHTKNIQSGAGKHTVRKCSTLTVVIYDRLTSRRQVCSASKQPVQDSSVFVDSYSPSLLTYTFRLRALSGIAFPVFPSSAALASFAVSSVRGSGLRALEISLTCWVSSVLFLYTPAHDNLHHPKGVKSCCSSWFSLSHSSRSLQYRSVIVCFDVAVLFHSCPRIFRYRAIKQVA